MTAWREQPGTDGTIEHYLEGRQQAAVVQVDHALKRTVISVVHIVDGTDPATVDRCRRRAEDLLVTANKGNRR